MHICHINLASGFSGGERQTLLLIQQQIKLGYQITVIANPKSPFANEIKQLNCHLFLAKSYLRQHNKIITQNCDLIHVHEGRAIYWALIQSKLFNIPYVITRRIDNPLKKKWFSNRAYSNASALIGLSNVIVKKIKERYPTQNIYLIPSSPVSYPIDRNIVNTICHRFDNTFLIIQAAKFLKHKGHVTTIETAKILQQQELNIHIVLLGDGQEREKLEKLTAQHNLTNITFVGKQKNMGDWFSAADLLIHPSYTEGLGSVILEAILAGLPIVASNAGGIPDIIENNISGLLVEPKDAQALAEAITNIVADESLRQRLIDGGNKKIKQFDIKETSLLYQNLYQKVIDEKTDEK